MKIVFQSDAGKQFRRNMDALSDATAEAIGRTARKTGSTLAKEIFRDIQSAGHFGKSWRNAVKTETVPKRGPASSATVTVRYSSSPLGSFAQAFEEGALIRGRPLLWIPLSFTRLRMSAAKYARTQGGLFRVDRNGKPPLLFSKKDRKPKYVGLSEVHLRKRFHIKETIERVVARVPSFYAEQFAKVMASTANK